MSRLAYLGITRQLLSVLTVVLAIYMVSQGRIEEAIFWTLVAIYFRID